MTRRNIICGARCVRLTLIAGALFATLAAAPAWALDPTPTAQYTVRFDGVWSPATHPIEFPPGPHFSPLVGATHQLDQRFWQEGTRASHGIRRMAEEGRSGPLANEVRAAISAGTADQVLEGGGIARSPGSRNLSFEVHENFPAVTLVSMIAPSPDWFVGVSALSLKENGEWVTELVLPLFAYDAGTDSGTTFLSPNAPSIPTVPVHRIQGGSLGNGQFLGTFTFTRTDAPPPPALALQEGRFRIRVAWERPNGDGGFGHGTALTTDSGTFWFFDAANVELIVKVINACEEFDRFWFFAAGLTNVGVEIEVEDTEAGEIHRWENPVGQPFVAIQNTTAFATCP
ncbi:MAG: spondin domain-containing protein [Acidobacteriota bacterium]